MGPKNALFGRRSFRLAVCEVQPALDILFEDASSDWFDEPVEKIFSTLLRVLRFKQLRLMLMVGNLNPQAVTRFEFRLTVVCF